MSHEKRGAETISHFSRRYTRTRQKASMLEANHPMLDELMSSVEKTQHELKQFNEQEADYEDRLSRIVKEYYREKHGKRLLDRKKE